MYSAPRFIGRIATAAKATAVVLCLGVPVCASATGTKAGPAPGSVSESGTVAGASVASAHAMVVTADSIASAVGNQVLLDGGNAVDAAVAVGFALAVTYPRAGNIGGGGFMLVRLADGAEAFIDYREAAPGGAGSGMYLDANGEVIPDLSTVGHRAAGVPGTVAGLRFAHEAYGTMPWDRLLTPAIALARDGFCVPPSLERSLTKAKTLLSRFEESRRIFITPGLRRGDRMVQSDLARTLERIAADWRDFYRGETARLIVAEMEQHGGLITFADLGAYKAVSREPLRFRYGDCEIVSAPPPSSGGVLLAQILGMLALHRSADLPRQSAAYVHLVCEAEKIAYRGRALYLGDVDFYPSPWREMISPKIIRGLSAMISPDSILAVETLEGEDLLQSARAREPVHTTHYSIVDRWGNAVANTYTLNDSYGSGVTVESAGFLLNNEMDDFAIAPDHPNLYGLVGSEANAIEPGKRMLSSMVPTIVLRDRGLYMVLGTPGGSTIPTSILQVILNVVDYGMPIEEAVTARRFHEQYLPDRIYIENRALAPDVIDALIEMGHKIEIREPIGEVQAIMIERGKLTGACDPRGSGRAVGH